MKKIIKKIVQSLLRVVAQGILRKYNPEIIGVTGSVGKTSTKEAIFSVLENTVRVRRSVKNYNNEIGLPLTIIGTGAIGGSIFGWLRVFVVAVKLLIWRDPKYPEVLILEMGIDRPGDMKYLTTLAPCKVGVLTGVGTAHLEHFKTVERLAKEKAVIITHLTKNGWAIVNIDNETNQTLTEGLRARLITYAVHRPADLQAKNIKIATRQDQVGGLSFKLLYQGSTVPVLLPHIIGGHFVYAALVAAAIGIIYGMNIIEISKALEGFHASAGRMSLLPGIKNTKIIDDTYNASPDSMIAALVAVGALKIHGKRIAVLGDMLELGDQTVAGHERVGQAVIHNYFDILITVGERAKSIASSAVASGMLSDVVFSFADVGRAGRFLQDRLEEGDLVLVKGSRGMRMERVVKEVMAEPLRADELLVQT
jgi:UDP-N-acetylmuramoyl-tripeptide--D-alanyl-D-alanine ligase